MSMLGRHVNAGSGFAGGSVAAELPESLCRERDNFPLVLLDAADKSEGCRDLWL
jgi:hypothetical protein